MTYMLETTDGQRYSAKSLDEIAQAVQAGTVGKDAWAWHEGLTEWIPIMSLFPVEIDKPSFEDNAKKAVGVAAGLLAKAGVGMAGFAAKSYRKATLKNRFSSALASMLVDGKLDKAELAALEQMVREAGASWDEVITDCRPMAEQFIRHILADAAVDAVITEVEESDIRRYIKLFGLGEGIKSEVNSIIRRLRLLKDLRNNKLPVPMPLAPAWIQSGEAVYACQAAELYKEGVSISQGKIWVTSMRVEYVAPKAGFSMTLARIREVYGAGAHLAILSVKGKSDIWIAEAETICALILCLVRLNNRTATLETDDTTQSRRRISKEVRNAIWIRDGGICVECGADDYLEFDHVIPVAKGGSNTVENVQLLCRRCNGKKSDKI